MPQSTFYNVSIGPGYGVVPSGQTPLPELMLAQIYVALWRR